MNFLFELGVEEFPAIPFLKEQPNLQTKWLKALENSGLSGEFQLEFTPRRVVIFGQMSQSSHDLEVEHTGAPRKIAQNEDGSWSGAALSFAKKCGISPSELKFAEVKGKEVLYFKSITPGKSAKELLNGVINEFVSSLNFGKSMCWGTGEFEFIRPVRNLVVLLNGENVPCEVCGVKSEKAFLPHRKFGFEKIPFATAEEYFEKLSQNGVILEAEKREAKILKEFKDIEAKSSLRIEIDEDLLKEVVTITENPTALLGRFEEAFLDVPPEAIILSMKENQRYFPLFDGEKLSNHFVVVSNAMAENFDIIVAGNERVLRARLSDAAFFWQQDLSGEFSAEKLKNISYLEGLGSVYEKEIREVALAKKLAGIFGVTNLDELEEAVMLSKADLTSAMVYEFTELQGTMGSYYAKAFGKSDAVSLAIREQYLPTGESSPLPSTPFSACVALAVKFDTLLAMFSVGKIPTGTKDPYALRRAALGVLKIVLNAGVKFELSAFLREVSGLYAKFDMSVLESFILERLYALSSANASVVKACLSGGCKELGQIWRAVEALEHVVRGSEFRENFSTFKRVANILKDVDVAGACGVNEALFEAECEANLWRAFCGLNLNLDDLDGYFGALFGLKEHIDAFFEGVIINADDPKVKANRVALVGAIYGAFLCVADIKEITL